MVLFALLASDIFLTFLLLLVSHFFLDGLVIDGVAILLLLASLIVLATLLLLASSSCWHLRDYCRPCY
jgi:hypothetical protein